MNRDMMTTISAAYTVYTLLNPDDKVTIGLDSFTELVKGNLAILENAPENKVSENAYGRLDDQKAEAALQKGIIEAEKTVDDKEKLSDLLIRLKEKMKTMPMVGSVLTNIPTMFRLLSSYLKGEYTDILKKQLVILVSAISYLVAPIDLVPDFIPLIGLLDDIAVISACVKLISPELEKYLEWRKNNVPTNKDEATEEYSNYE